MEKPSLIQTRCLLLILFAGTVTSTRAQTVKDSTTLLFNIDTVAKYLGYPWEILPGPDDSLWITEARGYRVVRISKGRTQAQKNLPPQQVLQLRLGVETNFDRSVNRWPQGGMQGLALHPEFMTNPNRRWAYLSYVYKQESCVNGSNASYPNGFPCMFRSQIVRCRFYFAADAGNPSVRMPKQDTLIITDTLLSNLPGSNDHNSGRLAMGPVPEGPDNTYKLYYTIGDMGAGQFNNDKRTNYAQVKDTLEGKILRLNTEEDTDTEPATPRHDFEKYCRWIPNDNPFTHSLFTTVRTPVYSFGHRNAQGIAWGNVGGTWRLYSSEHGDKSDDETNVILAGGNYGWPKVAGLADNNYSDADAYGNNDLLAGQSVSWSESTWAAANNMQRPAFSFFNAAASAVPSSGANIFTWPTIAPSSIDFYDGNIPGWKNSLLVTSLKYGMYRMKLNAAGTYVDSTCSANLVDTFPLLHGWRVRDVAINPVDNSGQFWVVMDSTGSTSGPTGGFNGSNNPTKDGGYVLRLTYKNPITLPVQFVRFDGRLQNQSEALLTWQAASDDKLSFFDVEKSADGQRFTVIGRVGRAGNHFADRQPLIGNNFYRIKSVEVDGKAVYTNIINLAYQPASFALRLFPNPVNDALTVQLNTVQSEKLFLEISDITGRIVQRQQVAPHSGAQTVLLNTSGWSSQTYLLKATDGNGRLLGKQWFVK